ncbi:hypothetical protein COR23_19525, partial [Vibrio cholerae]|nr:hypothetical protein [Vibrio cholerae]
YNNANALCDAYKSHRIGGRTNWRLAKKDELKTELFDRYGDMFKARGWASNIYVSATLDGRKPYYVYYVSLYNGMYTGLITPYPDRT